VQPVARFDIVPWQRIEHGETFKAGVVAFSKPGVTSVEFTISGCGYSGGTKISTEMTLNDRVNVWEYWVSISTEEFTSSGTFTLSAVVTDNDGNTRNLDAISLRVDHDSTLAKATAWVDSVSGNNATAEVDNESLPYADMATALSEVQTANGGVLDGCVIYFEEGTYVIERSTTLNTSNEWLTFTKSSSADKANVIFREQGSSGSSAAETDHLRFYNVSLVGDHENQSWLTGWPDNEPTWLWVDNCNVYSTLSRHATNVCPIWRGDQWFCTDTYIHNVDIAMRFADIVRNVDVYYLGDDCCFNCDLVVNLTLNDQTTNYDNYNHADGWQNSSNPMSNRIVYGYYGTDMHVQGIFIRMAPSVGTHQDNAFVNVFIEMRPPGFPGYEGGEVRQSCTNWYGAFDHLLVWNCTFPFEDSSLYDETDVPLAMTNSSWVGNEFHAWMEWYETVGDPISWTQPGNAENNEFLYNHYEVSRVDDPDESELMSRSPDSSSEGTQSLGDPGLDLTIGSDDFGNPQEGSILIDRIPTLRVPVDVHLNERSAPDTVGAVYYQVLENIRYTTDRWIFGS
jgi:hypothetical protein